MQCEVSQSQWIAKMQYEVSRKCSASIAHRIFGHPARCKNLHGHNYHFTLHLGASALLNGMVMDFGDIKKMFDEYIDTNWDHHTLLFDEDSMAQYFKRSTHSSQNFEVIMGDSLVYVPWNPTAENMAAFLVQMVRDECFKAGCLPNLTYIRVDVEETDGNTATATQTIEH